jgi:hypothetical protein
MLTEKELKSSEGKSVNFIGIRKEIRNQKIQA